MRRSLSAALAGLRAELVEVFAEDTASIDAEAKRVGWRNLPPSTGHCAVASILVRSLFGGDFMSARVHGASHWFNSIPINGALYEADITGDQFGLARVRVKLVRGPGDEIYPESRVRHVDDINAGTWSRYRVLVARLEAA